MIEYELEFTQEALDDIQRHKKSGNKPLLKKLEKLLLELRQHPSTGTGQVEILKHYKEETWSRRNCKPKKRKLEIKRNSH